MVQRTNYRKLQNQTDVKAFEEPHCSTNVVLKEDSLWSNKIGIIHLPAE